MLEFKIKKIKPHQLNKLSKILVEVYFKTFTNKQLAYPCTLRDRYLLNLRDLKKYIKKNDCEIYIAISNNIVLGGVFYYSSLDDYGLQLKLKSNKTSAIRYLAVKSKYNGNSIGKALIDECINLTKKDKNKKLVLHTLDSMKEAIQIYKEHEFKRFKKIDFNVGKICAKGYSKNL